MRSGPKAVAITGALASIGRAAAIAALLLAGVVPAVAANGASNSATLAEARQIRAKLAAAGFDNVVNLQQRPDGTWSGRAQRFGTTVRVEIDRDGKISIV